MKSKGFLSDRRGDEVQPEGHSVNPQRGGSRDGFPVPGHPDLSINHKKNLSGDQKIHKPLERFACASAVDTLDFNKWCSFLAISVLRTRSPFSKFLHSTLHLQRGIEASVSPLFPLPIPFPGVFARMPSGLSASKRCKIHFRRAIHVMVMALNFWWAGSCFISIEHLRRTPSKSQRSFLHRLSGLVLADGPLESFEVIRSGRRFPQLVARLCDLSDVLAKLGVGAGPYERTFSGHSVPLDVTRFQELEPYKSLDASRLKVVGHGRLDATPFLTPELCMAYRYPDSLLIDVIPKQHEYPATMDSAEEVLSLARLWDARGLLYIHDIDLEKERRFELVRVFNCLKNTEVDRQIGDRRGRNAVEARVSGPSKNLPTGPDLLDFSISPDKEFISVVCTDRRDFYHQFATSTNRTLSNTVGPVLALNDLVGTSAFEQFQNRSKLRRQKRTVEGDKLGFTARQQFAKVGPGHCMIAFGSIFQGDHAGVEIATSAHEGILQDAGLLDDDSRLLASRPFWGDNLCQGLVIDDYFAIAKIPKGLLVDDPAMECLRRSKARYLSLNVLGSDDKDIKGVPEAKVIGAYVNGSLRATQRGHVLVSAPPAKRYSLSWLTLQICQLTHTTDSLHLCLLGGWTSIAMFRRPFMSLLQKSFQVVDMENFTASKPKMLGLSRTVATELVLLAVLSPLIVSDIAAEFGDRIFATDASLAKGAIVSAQIGPTVSKCAWRAFRSKGGYSKLLTPVQSILARCMDFEEIEIPKEESVKRPLAYRFDFIEIYAGAATVTEHVARLGYSVGCPIDISFSDELNMKFVHVLEWILHLIANHFLKSFMIEPPCTTFSVMRVPPLRSKEFPFGFCLEDEQTTDGTELAYRSFEVMKGGLYHGVTGVLENPWTSKIKFLPGYEVIASDEHCDVVRCDSCAYGSIHLKSFMFLCAWAEVAPISKRCDGSHTHVQIQGQFTKKSATYVDALAAALAQVMASGIDRLNSFDDLVEIPKADGLENQLVNELCCSLPWELESVWTFKVATHINLLELSAVVRLAMRLAKSGRSIRLVVLIDSNVVKCAAAKGRSSSKLLCKALCRLAAICVLAGLYMVFAYAPTRLNPADDPTRDVCLRLPTPGLGISGWGSPELFRLAAVPRCRRWISNWVRLVLLVCGPYALALADRSSFRCPRFPYGFTSANSQSVLASAFADDSSHSSLDFDATLGYPGEGPVLGLSSNSLCPLIIWVWIWAAGAPRCHGVLAPKTPGDFQRQAARSNRPPLVEGRPVLGVTNQARQGYLGQFESWLQGIGISLEELLENHVWRIDELNKLLVRYGRNLYAVGRPYNHYAETINALASKKPAVKRQMQEAWNLAFAWVRDEPPVHHIAMPWQILLAAITVCFSWGWMEMAGMLALMWGGLLRVGEFLQATRADLLLPVDTGYTNQFALLSLKEPKTRFTTARHQTAKLDIPDLLQVVHLAFSRLSSKQKLWCRSGQTLRNRFKAVLLELGITPQVQLNGKGLDLASLRPGGATWLLQTTENGELTRRRGRWVNQRVMDIYIYIFRKCHVFSFWLRLRSPPGQRFCNCVAPFLK